MGKRGPKPKYREFMWTSDFAYAIGLMACDGNLSGDGRHLSFVSKDLEQVENLMKCLDFVSKIVKVSSGYAKDVTQKEFYKLQWSDVILYDYFLSLGLSSNKSLIIGSLKIPDQYFFDFLRGSFDGDGCFYSYFGPRWKNSFMFYLNFVSASKTHIYWIRYKVKEFLNIEGSYRFGGRCNGMASARYAKADSFMIINRMYENKNCTHLSRKRLKIEAALRIVNKSIGNY